MPRLIRDVCQRPGSQSRNTIYGVCLFWGILGIFGMLVELISARYVTIGFLTTMLCIRTAPAGTRRPVRAGRLGVGYYDDLLDPFWL